ncbi:uncharacterized protein LOC135333147 [Halichondria panicea]|uniref:uncharacterized protein LOC135333147 n=1 Tax=Halichondria panicea TaxID=6063 RepID=UPI00312BB534
MLRPIIIALITAVLLVASTASTARQLPKQPKLGINPTVNLSCVEKHCVGLSAECVLDKGCRETVECSSKCFHDWDKDTSPQKFVVQNCTNKCVFTYGEEETFKDYMGCLTDNKCISFPPISSTCKASSVKPVKQLSTKSFDGKWWVQRGYHKLYDCWPCQTIELKQINETAWLYTPQYETYLVNNSLTLVTNQHFVIPNTEPGENISFIYHDMGLVHSEVWWPLDKADDESWIIMYYCGTTAQWNYEGAMVMSKIRILDLSTYKQIGASYKQAVGLDINDFCFTDTSSDCMNT